MKRPQEIEKSKDDSQKMFKAIRYLKMEENKTRKEIKVQNKEGNYVFSDEMKAKTIAECFREEMADTKRSYRHF